MNNAELITHLQLSCGATLVKVKFANGNNTNEYTYKHALPFALSVGDLVVVYANNEYKVVTVTAVNVPLEEGERVGFGVLKHIVAKVDTTAFQEVEAREQRAMAELRNQQILQRLDQYRATMGDTAFNSLRLAVAPECDAVVETDA